MQEQQKSILVLDANAFISTAKVHQLGHKHRLVTTPDVILEIKDQKTREYVENLPFKIQEMECDKKSLQFVKQFAKKTGDIGSLSDVDLELIALAHTLYMKNGLQSKIRKQPPPLVQKVVQVDETNQLYDQIDNQQQQAQEQTDEVEQDKQKNQQEEGWISVPKAKKVQSSSEDSDMDEDEGWVTPVNYQQKMAQINTGYLQKVQQNQAQIQEKFQVSVISADYAVQNVLTQMGIKLISLDGRVISSIRRFIWECYLCWKQFKIDDNKVRICNNCGYNSLSKIAYSIDINGNVILHRKKGWKPNQKILQWKQKKFKEQQKKKKHQHQRRTKKPSIFDVNN